MTRFNFKNYVPRAELAAYAEQRMDELLTQLPLETEFSAAAMRLGNLFHFELKVRIAGTTYSSWAREAVPCPPADRGWQKAAIDSITADILNQLKLR